MLTNVLGGSQLETPKPIRIILRAGSIEGTTLPVYALSDHIFVMSDGSDGRVELFDGFYQAAFDGNAFESGYTKVEGIGTDTPVIIMKVAQPVWPEWTGENTAEDIGGRKYILNNGEWTEQEASEGDEAVLAALA